MVEVAAPISCSFPHLKNHIKGAATKTVFESLEIDIAELKLYGNVIPVFKES